MDEHIKKELGSYKEFYRHYLDVVTKLCRVAERVDLVRRANAIAPSCKDGQETVEERYILKQAAHALELYGYGATVTTQAAERLEADLAAYGQVESALAAKLRIQIGFLFGQDEILSWLGRREDCLKSMSSDESAARARHFSRYLAANAEDETVLLFAPSIVEESFRVSEGGCFPPPAGRKAKDQP